MIESWHVGLVAVVYAVSFFVFGWVVRGWMAQDESSTSKASTVGMTVHSLLPEATLPI